MTATAERRTLAPRVLAVIVSFNGGASPAILARAMWRNGTAVHVVDNASGPESQEHLASLAGLPGVALERLPENRGIGYALNRGLARARAEGFEWLITLDQDSVPDDGMMAAFARAIAANPDLAMLTPSLAAPGETPGQVEEHPDFAITSGNMVRLDVFDRIGDFNEDLFIDFVDFDFSLRVRAGGHRIVRVKDAVLRHRVGEVTPVRGPLARFYLRHSPVRHYYMYRNYLFIVRHYGVRHPWFVGKTTIHQLMHLLSIAVHEPRRVESLRFIGRGVRDYFAGRMGRFA